MSAKQAYSQSPPGLFSLNGFGTTLYGHKYAEGARYQAIMWVVALWVPLVPLGTYRVTPVDHTAHIFPVISTRDRYLLQRVTKLDWKQAAFHFAIAWVPIVSLVLWFVFH